MKSKLPMIVTIVLVSAFLLYSLNFGWPGMTHGWVEAGAPKPRWFPSFFGGVAAVLTSGLAFFLMSRWRDKPGD